MAKKKKPMENLPREMAPADPVLPGNFGRRILEGVTKSIKEAVGPVFDGHTQGETMREKKKKR